MGKKAVSAVVAAVAAAGGALAWWRQRPASEAVARPVTEELPASARSLSAQPHKRVRLTQPTATPRSDAPAPDSAEDGRTPYYFVPGEALLALHSAEPPDAALVSDLVAQAGGQGAPLASGSPGYPAPEGDGWLTVARLRWPDAPGYEETMVRFRALEARVNEGLAQGGARVASWMPNWLGSLAAAEAPRPYTPGGPASYPRPVAARAGGLPFKEVPFLHEWRAAAQHPVTLAVLDAFPATSALAGRPLPASLAALADELRARPQPLALDGTAHYAVFRTGVPFDMSDHGLMSAWLAAEVVGEEAMARVRLEPIRVATADGTCSALDVIAGLAPLVQRARQGENIVALLAFVLGMGDIIPPRLRPYEEHYEALRLCCLAFSEAGGTLVGAAGNDATGLQHPPRTRIPASFRSVIEVTAGQLRQPGLALYANQAKALSLFGGETNLQFQTAANIPALVGPAVAPQVRDSATSLATNDAGWIAWAGTSFAAALAAGLAALLRSHQPDLPMWEIRTRLRALATGTRNPGNVPFVDLVEAWDEMAN